jgi:hypothetical protein
MRAFIGFSAVVALMCVPAIGWSQQNSPQAGQPTTSSANSNQNKNSSAQSDQAAQAAAPQQTSLAEAARKARDEKKAAKPAKVFTNDNIPTTGGISPAGSTTPKSEDANANAATAASTASSSAKDEKTWRDKFAELRQKLDKDKENLDLMQRELGTLNLQYYPDPTKAMQQQLSRDDINKKAADIENKRKDIAADEQAINDAEDALRKAGGDPGWAR